MIKLYKYGGPPLAAKLVLQGGSKPLNGPSPGMLKNQNILERALVSHFNGNFASHFVNTSKFERGTSVVVNPILNPVGAQIDAILPCFT